MINEVPSRGRARQTAHNGASGRHAEICGETRNRQQEKISPKIDFDRERLRVVSYRVTLDIPGELTPFVSGLLAAIGTRHNALRPRVTGRQVTFDGKGATWCDATGGSIFIWAMVSR